MRDEAFVRDFEAALQEGREADRVEPRAEAVRYDADRSLVVLTLRNGFELAFDPRRIPGLERGTAAQLSNPRLSPSRDGIHWDDLDASASLTGLVAEAFNLREWAPRIMGGMRSEAKARASRENGLKGGRPRGSASR